MKTVDPALLALLRESIGAPLTPELAARICAAAAPPASPRAINSEDHPAGTHGGVTFHVERMADVIDEIRPLHAEHWAETEEYRWVVGMEVDYDQYVAAERQGQFALFTCRENGKMVGYVMMDIYRSRHTSRPQGTEDGLYLHPSARKGSRAVAFLRYVLSRLAAMGVRPVVLTSKVAHDIGALYRRLGGKRVAEVYVVGGDR